MICAFALLGGCDAASGPTDAGSSSMDAAADEDASVAPASCPEAAPAIGDDCPVSDAYCTYGTTSSVCADRTTLYCSGDTFRDASRDPGCSDGSCPSTATSDDACDDIGQTCFFDDGRVCVCVTCLPSGSDAGPCERAPTYRCAAASGDPRCPRSVPAYGSDCPEEGLRCGWGGSESGCSPYPAFECRGGGWQPYEAGCV